MTTIADRQLDAYRAELIAEGDRTATQVEALLAAWVLEREDAVVAGFAVLAAAAVAAAQARAVALSVRWLADHVAVAAGVPVVAVPVDPARYRDLVRVEGVFRAATAEQRTLALAAAERSLADRYAREAIARRQARKIASHEVVDAGRSALSEAMGRTPEVTGWTRRLQPGACPLCRDLAGPVQPAGAPLFDHAGCSCTQQPVVRRSAR